MLGARQKLGYLTRKETLLVSKLALGSTRSRLARAKSAKFTVWDHSDSGVGADRGNGLFLPSRPGSFLVSAEGLKNQNGAIDQKFI